VCSQLALKSERIIVTGAMKLNVSSRTVVGTITMHGLKNTDHHVL
jgi:uncharacterized protein (UPF0303 family)